MGRGGEVLPSRDSTRIVKTSILSLQRYELFLKVPNILKENLHNMEKNTHFAVTKRPIQFYIYKRVCQNRHVLFL